ncbi:MCE family protein [Gordonia liuliyuniae]|uniref:MCE family protein n=1 Tax=Gordonia liuliyuniae TaxID=2911517 RepID=A0ABS9IN93_9ACTN|nr:MCE family protein [Gordonia liuliyuniae]MCF8587025.1 MCE family protein [Gordonia liuliyuniae]
MKIVTAPFRWIGGIIGWVINPRQRTESHDRALEFGWGVVAIGVTLVAIVIGVAAYWYSPGHYRVVAQFSEAGQLESGDSVRVAGVPVGTVKSVELRNDHVDVEMAVRWGTFLGDETNADVKMLTLVGGSYIDLTTVGTDPLGDDVIPESRTSIPYSLAETFQKMQPKLDEIDAAPARKSIAQIGQALDDNPDALRENLTTIQSMLTNLQNRQDEFGSMLALAADYSEQINANGDVLTQLARNLDSFVTEYSVFGSRLNVVLDHLALLLERVRGLAMIYMHDIAPLVDQIDAVGREFGPALERYGPMISRARDLIYRLEGMVQPDGSIVVDQGKIVLTSDFCIPLPGVTC